MHNMLYLDIYTHAHIYTYLKNTLNLYTCDSENSYISLWCESELTYEQQII